MLLGRLCLLKLLLKTTVNTVLVPVTQDTMVKDVAPVVAAGEATAVDANAGKDHAADLAHGKSARDIHAQGQDHAEGRRVTAKSHALGHGHAKHPRSLASHPGHARSLKNARSPKSAKSPRNAKNLSLARSLTLAKNLNHARRVSHAKSPGPNPAKRSRNARRARVRPPRSLLSQTRSLAQDLALDHLAAQAESIPDPAAPATALSAPPAATTTDELKSNSWWESHCRNN